MADALTGWRPLGRALARLGVPALAALPVLIVLAPCSTGSQAWAADTRGALLDPTAPPPGFGPVAAGAEPGSGATPAPAETLRLQMIARNGSSRLAVVNGRSVHTGDSLTVSGKSITVVAIGDDSVVLQQDGHRQRLELAPHAGLIPVCAANASQRSSCRRDPPGASR